MGQTSRRRREHLIDRMRDRAISVTDLNRLRVWIESKPEVPEGDWYEDFGSFKICGRGSYPKRFLLRGQAAKGESLSADTPESLLSEVRPRHLDLVDSPIQESLTNWIEIWQAPAHDSIASTRK